MKALPRENREEAFKLIKGGNISELRRKSIVFLSNKSLQRPQILEKSDNKEQSGSQSNISLCFIRIGQKIL